LYAYVHNNPFRYRDPDGRFAFVLPFLVGAFGTGGLVLTGPTIGALAGIAVGTAIGWGVYEACKWADNTYNQIETDDKNNEIEIDDKKVKKKGKDNKVKPPRS